MSKNMINKKSWKEFQSSGLLWYVNNLLHLLGWAIVFEVNKHDEITNVYPARVKFRGFDKKSTEEGYVKVTNYLKDNIDKLKKETDA